MDIGGIFLIILAVILLIYQFVDYAKPRVDLKDMPKNGFGRFLYIIVGIPLLLIGFILVVIAPQVGLQVIHFLLATPTPTFHLYPFLTPPPFPFPTPTP
jgi:hypothetical protein